MQDKNKFTKTEVREENTIQTRFGLETQKDESKQLMDRLPGVT